jgi:hypothetical protein
VDQLLDQYLDVVDVDESTLKGYVGYIKNHIRPALGGLQVARVDGEVLDTSTRSCGAVANAARAVADTSITAPRGTTSATNAAASTSAGHWPRRACARSTGSCPAPSTALSAGAGSASGRSAQQNPLRPPRSNPSPPNAAQAAKIVNEAWRDPDWGALVWTFMSQVVDRWASADGVGFRSKACRAAGVPVDVRLRDGVGVGQLPADVGGFLAPACRHCRAMCRPRSTRRPAVPPAP